ncbi:MAG: FkbM family methyltransferase [Cyanobium sp. PLM2.Bin73]|nr:MAG: FkbM family methyltransferase [Cyanobium sp. PLM2.Bin73]
MNTYIEKNLESLPLLRFCSGPGTQEDGIISHLLDQLQPESKFLVEFGQRTLGGATLGRIAASRGFSLLNIDSEALQNEVRHPWNDNRKWILRKQSVGPLNINQIFDECEVPEAPAVCVIDVDGMDYWFMLAILQKRRPSLIICEYNCHIPANISASLAFNPDHQYQRNKDYGASLLALAELAESHGYRLIHIHGPLNLFFVPTQASRDLDCTIPDAIKCPSTEGLRQLADTELFYDSFHSGQRPSWFGACEPDSTASPWIRLAKIGEGISTISIDEIDLRVYSIDKGGGHYRQRGHKEDSVSPLWRLIRHRLSPDIVVDIGANYGYTASLLAKRLGAKKVIAIEPDPRLTGILKRNLKENIGELESVVIQAAVSQGTQCVSALGINPQSTQDNRVCAQHGWEQIVVPTISLNEILSSISDGRRVFIKSDTQGFDINVIKSGFEWLSQHAHWMLRCEFAPFWMESQGFSAVDELEWLCCNFRVCEAPLRIPWNSRLEEVFNRPLEASHALAFVDYSKSLNHDSLGWVDLYVFPSEYA